MKSFKEIGEELGVTEQRAGQIYAEAMRKTMEAMDEEDRDYLLGVLAETERDNMFDLTLDAMHNAMFSVEEDLRGFWREENNV